ncbi:MAG TPA: 23S rRNA (guanosine(2251)-2'-O)-methyltransferase RlmB [Thermoanaerobaculia bacterium]|jgi:23S rRNA (guanosine2251-2'-O)-methyltransferase
MIVYGANPVIEAIRSHPDKIRYIGITRDGSTRLSRLVNEAKNAGVAVRQMTATEIDKLTGRGVHNGVIAEVADATYADFDDMIARESTQFVLILDGVTDPQNLGAILRVADAFAVDLVVLPQHESVGLTAVAVKASAGASEWVPVTQVTNLARAIETLKEAGYWTYAAAGDGDAPLKVDFRGKVALVLGNEGKGIRRNVLEHCDRVITIPMFGHVESLNVATAAAILCYEVARQTRP